MQKQLRSRVKRLFWPGIACCFLVGFCSFCLYTGTVEASSSTTSSFFITPTVTASPISTTATPTMKPTPIVIIVTPRATTQSNSQDYLTSLISGFFGALLGGILTYLGSVNAAKKQIDYLYKQERESRNYVEKQQKETIRNAFMVELRENIDLLLISERNMLLSSEAWSLYKGNIAAFSSSLQEELITTYSATNKYNSILEQISSMYRQNMDNNLLFPLQAEQQAKVLSQARAVLKRLSQE